HLLLSATDIFFIGLLRSAPFCSPHPLPPHTYTLSLHDALPILQRDEFGRELQRIQGNVVTHTDYDPMGRLARQHAIHRQQKNELINREYQYDPFGNPSSFKDGSWEVRYVYDMVDKLKRTEGDLNEHFVFDPAGNLRGQHKSETGKTTRGNRLHTQGDRKFDCDARGNLIRET